MIVVLVIQKATAQRFSSTTEYTVNMKYSSYYYMFYTVYHPILECYTLKKLYISLFFF